MNDICFYVTPIGSAESQRRRDREAILTSAIPAGMRPVQLKAIAAHEITEPDSITDQVIALTLPRFGGHRT